MDPYKVEHWPLVRPIPYARNARKIPQQAIDKVAASIKEFGWRQPIVVDADGVIIAGHTRLLAAQKLGMAEVPVHVAIGLSPEQVKAYRIADNRSSLETDWDHDLLRLELIELADLGMDLSEMTLFDPDELTELLAGDSLDQGDPDAVPDVSDGEPNSQRGVVYELGPHRLMCGDSTNAGDWKVLMGKEVADAVLTDPPYGVNYVGKTADALVVENDTPEGLPALLDGALGCALALCRPGGAWYVAAPAGPLNLHFANWLSANGVFRAELIWVKDSMVLGHGDYHYQHEPIFYGWKPGAPHRPPPDRKQVSVWEIPRPKRSAEHPTMKPVALYEKMLLNSTIHGEIILEPFGGSGTTLIASAKNGRVCRAMEISPVYCDVIRKRWTTFARENKQDHGTGMLE